MLKPLSNVEEVVQFFYCILRRSNKGMLLARIYGLACEQSKIVDKKREYIEILSKKGLIVEDISFVNEEITIVKCKNKFNDKINNFYSFLNGQSVGEVTDSFDYALTIALCHKYGYGTQAPRMIANMLQMDVE